MFFFSFFSLFNKEFTSNYFSKYLKLFLKASQIKQMKEILEKIDKEISNSVQLLHKKNHLWEKLRDEFIELKEKHDKCTLTEELRKKYSGLIHEYGWAVVINMENILTNHEEEFAKQSNKKEGIRIKLKKSEETSEEITQEYRAIKEKRSELNDQSKIAQTKIETANETYKKVAAKHKTVSSEMKRLTALIDKNKKERDTIRNKLEHDRNLDLGAKEYELERKQKEEKIKGIEEYLKERQDLETEKIQEYKSYAKEVDESQRILDNKGFEIKNIERLIKTISEDIENLEKSSNDQIYRFGNFMPIMLKDIDAHYQNRRFKEKPCKFLVFIFIDNNEFKKNLMLNSQ